MFEDQLSGASVFIEKSSVTGGYKITGVLDDGKMISPVAEEKMMRDPDCQDCLALNIHEVQLNDDNELSDRSDYEQVEAAYPRARRGKSLSGKINPEILILVDYFLYEKLNFNSVQTNKYILSFFNAVNLRFRALHSPSLDVELHIVGIIIAETKAAFPFITENIEKNKMIDAASTLNDMGRYFYKDR